MSGDRTPRLYAARDDMLANAEASPDNRLVAYNANDTGRFEVVVEGFPTPGTRWQASRDGGVHPRWRPDGRELYYNSAAGDIVAVAVDGRATPETPAIRVVLDAVKE